VGTLQVKIPDRILAQAKALRKKGVSWTDIGARVGYHRDTLRIRLDPEFRAKAASAKKEYSRAAFNQIRRSLSPFSSNVGRPPLSRDELEARRSLIPIDTRDNTARLCGDPIPGDRRRA
jgi:hypothetical protein